MASTRRTGSAPTASTTVYTSPSADGPRPAIVLVHGGPVAPDAQPRDWPGAVSPATLAAASALTGMVPDGPAPQR